MSETKKWKKWGIDVEKFSGKSAFAEKSLLKHWSRISDYSPSPAHKIHEELQNIFIISGSGFLAIICSQKADSWLDFLSKAVLLCIFSA